MPAKTVVERKGLCNGKSTSQVEDPTRRLPGEIYRGGVKI